MPPASPLWRIGAETPDYSAADLGGRGAERTGGRWNRPGTPVAYLSSSRALACLETLVHLAGGGPPLPLNRYLVRVDVPAEAWAARSVLNPAALVGWDAEPAGRASLDWGEAWARDGASLLAEVPSVVVPEEANVLLNPRHPAAASVRAAVVRRWTYDPRLVARGP